MHKSSLWAAAVAACAVGVSHAGTPLTPQLAAGENYSNVFSILHSLTAEGYEESARRNGGSADYRVLGADTHGVHLQVHYRYDGRAAADGEAVMRDAGRSNCTLKGGREDCSPYLDGSGLIYNPTLWGAAPKVIKPGMHWQVAINTAWELGGADSRQTVTVVSVDAATATVVLLREGSSQGLFGEGESAQRQLTRAGKEETVTLSAGAAHWKGYTTVIKGVIFSDELLVTREGSVRDAAGVTTPVHERWIMLLNAAPFATLS
jgi:hypothetical protein